MTDEVANEVAVSNTIYTGVSEGSGRIKIVTEPALPATCAVCARSANGAIQFVDFNVSLDYYGAIVICEDCIKECMSLFDYTPNINFTDKVNELVAKCEELEVVIRERDRYKFALDSLSFIRPDLNPITDVDELVDEDSEIGQDESGEIVSESSDPGESDESDSDGSTSSGGLKDLSIFAD